MFGPFLRQQRIFKPTDPQTSDNLAQWVMQLLPETFLFLVDELSYSPLKPSPQK
jgi:hypothetical protein